MKNDRVHSIFSFRFEGFRNGHSRRWKPNAVSVVIVQRSLSRHAVPTTTLYLESQLMPLLLSRDHPLVIVQPSHSYRDFFKFIVSPIDRRVIVASRSPTERHTMFHSYMALFRIVTMALMHWVNFKNIRINIWKYCNQTSFEKLLTDRYLFLIINNKCIITTVTAISRLKSSSKVESIFS